MVAQRGFVLVSVIVMSMLLSLLVWSLWFEARAVVRQWRYHDQSQQQYWLLRTAVSGLQTPASPPVLCDGWQTPLPTADIVWRSMTVPSLPAAWRLATHVDCYRHVGRVVYWRKAARLQLGDRAVVMSVVSV